MKAASFTQTQNSIMRKAIPKKKVHIWK